MIVSFILGGLGNQLFQYAVAKQVAFNNNVELKLETSGYHFKKYKIHPYALHHFNISASKASITDYLKTNIKLKIAKEKTAAFCPDILTLKDNYLLVGYWHSEKYFSGIKDILQQEITLKNSMSAKSAEVLNEIKNTLSVSIHVRRSDYLSATNASIFAICGLGYYKKAIDIIAQSINNPHFYIFSDDNKWAKENLKLTFPATYVTHNDVYHGYEDLMLMRACKHNIIANSTFSWWGAWLNTNDNKIVIAPNNWFVNTKYKEPDLIPNNWLSLAN